jgi:hypothetical protein
MDSPDKNGEKESLGQPTGWSESVRQPALTQLSKILESPQFRSSKRCSLFLRYVVEQASEHHFDGLKERTLGIEVFERDPHYDTNQDPVVRAAAGEVRKRLAQYYLEPGHDEELRISLPAGSYVPEIHTPPAKAAAVVAVAPEVAPPQSIFQPKVLLIAAGLIVAAAFAAFLSLRPRQTDLDRFWAPVLEPQGTVMVCLGQPKAYHFNSKTQFELEKWFADETEKKNPPPELATTQLSEIVPMWDRYIDLVDAQAFAQLSSLFAQKGKRTQLRGVQSVSLTDLRGKPCVLIGAFNNLWTLSLAGELRFYFDIDNKNGAEFISDRQHPEPTEWRVVNSWPYHRIPADYAIVTRVLNPTTEQTVVSVAGITHYGTHAAGEFLSTPAYFAEALSQAPPDWQRKNMQVVLSTKVMSGTHGPPKVQAVHFW